MPSAIAVPTDSSKSEAYSSPQYSCQPMDNDGHVLPRTNHTIYSALCGEVTQGGKWYSICIPQTKLFPRLLHLPQSQDPQPSHLPEEYPSSYRLYLHPLRPLPDYQVCLVKSFQ